MHKLGLATGVALVFFVSQAVVGTPIAIAGSSLSGTVTPPGFANLRYAPLASQNQSQFGETIAFVPAAYTPPGLALLMRLALDSQNESGFGYEIAFTPSAYTPPGAARVDLIDAVAVR